MKILHETTNYGQFTAILKILKDHSNPKIYCSILDLSIPYPTNMGVYNPEPSYSFKDSMEHRHAVRAEPVTGL